tara:strand:- start:666 stop:1058 length:393 start_codon:yes stop_codon:yes gene_type:complete
MGELAKKYVGEERGKISDPAMRDMVLKHRMNQRSLQLTQARAREENKSGRVPAETTSIFKLVGSTLTRENADLQTRLMGSQGYGWQGDQFSEQERTATRSWLRSRAVTIYGGTNEVQMNIISKRVLGLPD